jgi:hypothetical protein
MGRGVSSVARGAMKVPRPLAPTHGDGGYAVSLENGAAECRRFRPRVRAFVAIRNPELHPGVEGRRPGGEGRERPCDRAPCRPLFPGTS